MRLTFQLITSDAQIVNRASKKQLELLVPYDQVYLGLLI
jgi:hypothetical protein